MGSHSEERLGKEELSSAASLQGDSTPVAIASPPNAGPQEAPNRRDAELDAGLMALGMLSAPVAQDDRKSIRQPVPRKFEDGVDGADETVVVERVSPEEEERRYFAMINGGQDLFSDLPAPDPSAV